MQLLETGVYDSTLSGLLLSQDKHNAVCVMQKTSYTQTSVKTNSLQNRHACTRPMINKVWTGFNFFLCTGVSFLTAGLSVGILIRDFWSGERDVNLWQFISSGNDIGEIIGRNLSTWIPMLAATFGINWLSMSALQGLVDELNFRKFGRFVFRVLAMFLSGVPMAILLDICNLNFLVPDVSLLLKAVLMGITWIVVGNGMGGFIANDLITMWKRFVPARIIGANQRAFLDITSIFHRLIKLGLHGKEKMELFGAALSSLQSNSPAPVGAALTPILSLPYPVKRACWFTEIVMYSIAAVGSIVGAWGLKSLTEQGFRSNPSLSPILGWVALVMTVWPWTSSFGDFLIKAMNPIRHFVDSWQQSTFKDRGLRVVGAALTACFGALMGVVAYRAAYEKIPLVGELMSPGVQKLLETVLGYVINTLIGYVGLQAVWTTMMRFIRPSLDDHAHISVDAMLKFFLKSSPQAQREILLSLQSSVDVILRNVDSKSSTSTAAQIAKISFFSAQVAHTRSAEPMVASKRGIVTKQEVDTLLEDDYPDDEINESKCCCRCRRSFSKCTIF